MFMKDHQYQFTKSGLNYIHTEFEKYVNKNLKSHKFYNTFLLSVYKEFVRILNIAIQIRNTDK